MRHSSELLRRRDDHLKRHQQTRDHATPPYNLCERSQLARLLTPDHCIGVTLSTAGEMPSSQYHNRAAESKQSDHGIDETLVLFDVLGSGCNAIEAQQAERYAW